VEEQGEGEMQERRLLEVRGRRRNCSYVQALPAVVSRVRA